MKYTGYLINENIIDFKILETENKIVKPFSESLSIILAMSGVCIVSSMLPMTIAYDGFRSLKYQYCLYSRKRNNKTFINTSINNCRYWWYATNDHEKQLNHVVLHKIIMHEFNDKTEADKLYDKNNQKQPEELVFDEVMLN